MIPFDKKFLLENLRTTISAHNVQPFRLRFINETQWEIYAEQSRLLPFADPNLHDFWTSFGAFLETLDIVLAESGLYMSECILVDKIEIANKYFICSHLKIAALNTSHNDAIAAERKNNFNLLHKRFSYRGVYNNKIKINSESLNKNSLLSPEFKILLTDSKSSLFRVSKIFDDVNLKFLQSTGYIEELYAWLRFKKSNPRWQTDGLNTESMSMNLFEAWGAALILNPPIFRWLAKYNIVGSIISEKNHFVSSSGLVAITSPSASPIDRGRVFLRAWLRLTELNLYGAPCSLLTDDPESQKEIRKIFNIPTEHSLVNVLRVGPLPEGFQRPQSTRLLAKDLEIV